MALGEGGPTPAEAERNRALRLRRTLGEAWGSEAIEGFEAVRAPGRVNLIGEHTDYNAGFVLPAAVSLQVWLAFHPIEGRRVELTSPALGETRAFDLDGLVPPVRGRAGEVAWIDYAAGVAWSLIEAQVPVRGIRGLIDSDVPTGAGLGSSAALEVAVALALVPAWAARRLDPLRLAGIARRAEDEFVGMPSGVMDQLASAAGRAGHALLIDCRSLRTRAIRLSEDLVVVVCDSGVARQLTDSRYAERRAQCEEGVRLLQARDPSIRSLRDVDSAGLAARRADLPRTIARRCQHVVRENERTLAMARALERGDLAAVGSLMAESHASLRNLYEVGAPELDALVEITTAVDGVVGTRQTGAGFGGCTVSLVHAGAEDALRDEVLSRYPGRTGQTPTVHVVTTVDGARRIEIP